MIANVQNLDQLAMLGEIGRELVLLSDAFEAT